MIIAFSICLAILTASLNDFVGVYECERYTAATHDKDDSQMVFYIYSKYRDDGTEVAVDKKTRHVYIENSEGKTVGNFNWKYDENNNKYIRI